MGSSEPTTSVAGVAAPAVYGGGGGAVRDGGNVEKRESVRPAIGFWGLVRTDVKAKARWVYGADGTKDVVKVLLSDGTAAMVWYRLMQWAGRWRLAPLAMVFNKLNAICCNCIIGRGAEFGPGFVLVHSTGVVINGSVRGGRDVMLEHQVTIGAEGRRSPVIGDGVFIGAGAKVIGAVNIGDGARVGANAVVVKDVPAYSTVVGIPAKVVRQRPDPRAQQRQGGERADASGGERTYGGSDSQEGK